MIALTKLNGQSFILNAEKIRSLEETPDTLISLDGGERVVVKERIADVVRQSIDYARRCRRPLLD
ncbi:MAG: flagellar FlbD family protein [Planctomycetota bacterium]